MTILNSVQFLLFKKNNKTMKKLLVLIFITINFFNAYSQEDLIDKVTKQAVEIDGLKKRLEFSKTTFTNLEIQLKLKMKRLLIYKSK